jgi:hypothetical protein
VSLNAAERAAYEAWLAANRNRYGTALMNAFLAGYRAATPKMPTWDSLSTADKLDHAEACWGCALCLDGRAWGICTSCGLDPVEALPPEGYGRCCGSVVALHSPVEVS